MIAIESCASSRCNASALVRRSILAAALIRGSPDTVETRRNRLMRMDTPRKAFLAAGIVLVALALPSPGEAQGPQRTYTTAGLTGQGGPIFFDDFNDGTAQRWEPQGGVWTVQNGQYVGEGVTEVRCPGDGLGANDTLIRDLELSDVDMEVDMRSIQRVDKAIILRSTSPENQIELNFRADPFGDMYVQELVDCEGNPNIPEFRVPIPHQVGETIHVRAKLIGNHLQVWIDGSMVLDRSFSFVNTTGRVGLGVINDEFGEGITAFDNVQVNDTRDTTGPSIFISHQIPGPPAQLEITVQDTGTGLASISVQVADNCTVEIPAFCPGSQDPVLVVATKLNQSRPARVVLKAKDIAGNVTTSQ
jgi:hypothetical protein